MISAAIEAGKYFRGFCFARCAQVAKILAAITLKGKKVVRNHVGTEINVDTTIFHDTGMYVRTNFGNCKVLFIIDICYLEFMVLCILE